MTPAPIPRSVPFGHGFQWIRQAFEIFKSSVGNWIAIAMVLALVTVLLSAVPGIGSLAVNLLMPIALGGLILGTRDALRDGKQMKIEALWQCFQVPYVQPLALLGVAYLVISVVIAAVMMLTLFGSVGTAIMADKMGSNGAGVGGIGLLISLLLVLSLTVALAMATWFAPALVVLHGTDPVTALQMSFKACMRNLGPFTLYGLIMFALAIPATLLVGLGLLVLAPVAIISVYCAYQDIMGDLDGAAAVSGDSIG